MTVLADGSAGKAAASMLDRFTAIVDVFDGTAGLSLDSIALRARLPRSTTHRILDQLVRLDWVTHSDDGYRLGRRAMSWGAADAADLKLRSAAAPVLSRLHVDTSAVVHLGVLDRGHVVHLDKIGDATGSGRVPTQVGDRVAAHRTALGVAILGTLPLERVDDHLRRCGATEALADELGRELHGVRRDGVAHRIGDYRPTLASVAAAIDGRAAVGLVVPADVSAAPYKPLVRAAATRIRALLRA